jgi:hypothetical protein
MVTYILQQTRHSNFKWARSRTRFYDLEKKKVHFRLPMSFVLHDDVDRRTPVLIAVVFRNPPRAYDKLLDTDVSGRARCKRPVCTV